MSLLQYSKVLKKRYVLEMAGVKNGRERDILIVAKNLNSPAKLKDL